MKVRLLTGKIFQGTLIDASGLSQCFDVETNTGVITIRKEKLWEKH